MGAFLYIYKKCNMDWYRRKSWTPLDMEEFYAKLKRARKDSKPQYLKIQALEFIETKDEQLLFVAEELLNEALRDYPDYNFNKSSIYNALGSIYKIRKEYETALKYYKESLDFEKIYPNVITSSYLQFPEMVLILQKAEYYDLIEEILIRDYNKELFPVSRYKRAIMLASLSKIKGNDTAVTHYLKIAEENANAQTSGLRYHKKLGLVTEEDKMLEKINLAQNNQRYNI